MRCRFWLFAVLFSLALSGCGTEDAASPTLPSSAVTEIPDTATPEPTRTPSPPTPTPTPVPPSPTAEPTATPTETPLPPTLTPTPAPVLLRLRSAAFGSGAMVPERYARNGDNISPPLEWNDPPEGTQSFALLMVGDPLPDGGGTWVHWVIVNIPAEARALPEGLVPDEDGRLADGGQYLPNSYQRLAYDGPKTQHLETRRFYYRLFALDIALALDPLSADDGDVWYGSAQEILLEAMKGHILAQGELVGRYKE